MNDVLWEVDELFDAFASTLPRQIAPHVRGLACTLRLASEGVPWSEVFGHPVTLAAPALFAEAMPDVDRSRRRDAMLAQTLAAIEAFGTDRIEDAQVVATPELREALASVRRGRNEAVARVLAGTGARDREVDPEAAHAATLRAIAAERELLASGRAVSFEIYERTSLGKQSVGFPPSLALARAAGWDDRQLRTMHVALRSIWLALQMPDDVADWEDDWSRGGAWAVALAGGARRGESIAALRDRVFASGVLARMLERGRWHFTAARRLALALGAQNLAAWAAEHERKTASAADAERANAGRTARAHALIAWATEVLR